LFQQAGLNVIHGDKNSIMAAAWKVQLCRIRCD
jgi:hypothetical protein